MIRADVTPHRRPTPLPALAALLTLLTVTAGLLWATPAAAAGVARAAGGPLRTAYSHVRTTVDGDVARTEVTQVFVNDLDTPVEVSFGFPLPADATVTGFAEWRDGRRVDAAATAKDAAEAAYDAAADRGERAALVGTEGDRFRMKLMAVPPRGSRRVALQYVQTLPALGGERTYVFPADDSTALPSLLDIEVRVGGDRPVLAAEAPNQPDARIDATAGDGRVVRLSRDREGLAHDLVVRWREPAEPLDLAVRAVGVPDGAGVVEARFAFNADPWPEIRAPRDVVIVLDASLSMAGAPLQRAVEAARKIVAGLDPADRFDVVLFSDSAAALGDDLMDADRANRALADAALDDLRARGRSDLQGALKLAGERLRDSQDGVLVLLTDGQPTASAGGDPFGLSVDLAAFARTRVVLGHFNYPGRDHDLRALFSDLQGRYVPDGPAGEAVVGELVALAVAPVIEDLSVEVDGAVFAVHGALPSRLPLGAHVRLVGRLDGPATVRVGGWLHGRRVDREVALDTPVADGRGDRGLQVEWARLRVAALQAEWQALDDDEPARAALANEIKDLGTRFSLATRFTSYVLTDSLAPDRIKPGDPEIRVHAPASAERVFAILPWGEVVEAAWADDEGLWLGRFLVPRGTPDGLYRARIFVVTQGESAYRGALFFRVDSQPPPFTLVVDREDGPVAGGDLLYVQAYPTEPRLGAEGTDRIDRDPLDLRRLTVRLGEQDYTLSRVGDAEVWEAWIPVDVPPGTHTLRMIATDWARNSVTAEAVVDVE